MTGSSGLILFRNGIGNGRSARPTRPGIMPQVRSSPTCGPARGLTRRASGEYNRRGVSLADWVSQRMLALSPGWYASSSAPEIRWRRSPGWWCWPAARSSLLPGRVSPVGDRAQRGLVRCGPGGVQSQAVPTAAASASVTPPAVITRPRRWGCPAGPPACSALRSLSGSPGPAGRLGRSRALAADPLPIRPGRAGRGRCSWDPPLPCDHAACPTASHPGRPGESGTQPIGPSALRRSACYVAFVMAMRWLAVLASVIGALIWRIPLS